MKNYKKNQMSQRSWHQRYTKNYDRFSRLEFTKEKQQKLFENYDDNLSEIQNMANNKFNIIYDCGKIIYEL